MLKVISVCHDKQFAQPLINSLEKFSWDYCIIETPWLGFGTKLIETYKYLKANPDITHFIFCDAFDVIVLGYMQEFVKHLPNEDCMVVSSERGCWPDSSLEVYYEPLLPHRFNYVNSGLYYSPSSLFIEMIEANTPKYETDDQLYLTSQYLFNEKANIKLDQNCDVFQSYSFIEEDDYGYDSGRLKNLKTFTMPLWVHGNGRSDMRKIYELIQLV